MCHRHVLLWYRLGASVVRAFLYCCWSALARLLLFIYFIIYMQVWARGLCSYLFIDVGVHEHVLLSVVGGAYIFVMLYVVNIGSLY